MLVLLNAASLRALLAPQSNKSTKTKEPAHLLPLEAFAALVVRSFGILNAKETDAENDGAAGAEAQEQGTTKLVEFNTDEKFVPALRDSGLYQAVLHFFKDAEGSFNDLNGKNFSIPTSKDQREIPAYFLNPEEVAQLSPERRQALVKFTKFVQDLVETACTEVLEPFEDDVEGFLSKLRVLDAEEPKTISLPRKFIRGILSCAVLNNVVHLGRMYNGLVREFFANWEKRESKSANDWFLSPEKVILDDSCNFFPAKEIRERFIEEEKAKKLCRNLNGNDGLNFNALVAHAVRFQGGGGEKLKCLLWYLLATGGGDEAGVVEFEKVFMEEKEFFKTLEEEDSKPEPMNSRLTLHTKGMELAEIVTDHKTEHKIFTNFANITFGYGRFTKSCTQEEIMQMCCPEWNVGMLFFDQMEPDCVVLAYNCRRFSKYSGYLNSFRFEGGAGIKAEGGEVKYNPETILTMDAVYEAHFSS